MQNLVDKCSAPRHPTHKWFVFSFIFFLQRKPSGFDLKYINIEIDSYNVYID